MQQLKPQGLGWWIIVTSWWMDDKILMISSSAPSQKAAIYDHCIQPWQVEIEVMTNLDANNKSNLEYLSTPQYKDEDLHWELETTASQLDVSSQFKPARNQIHATKWQFSMTFVSDVTQKICPRQNQEVDESWKTKKLKS